MNMTSAGKKIPARKGPADVAVTRSTVSVVSPTFSGERLWAFARRACLPLSTASQLGVFYEEWCGCGFLVYVSVSRGLSQYNGDGLILTYLMHLHQIWCCYLFQIQTIQHSYPSISSDEWCWSSFIWFIYLRNTDDWNSCLLVEDVRDVPTELKRVPLKWNTFPLINIIHRRNSSVEALHHLT